MKKFTLFFAFLLSIAMASTVSAQTVLDIPSVGTASRVTLTGFTANWTAVPNATSYAINVYDGSNALVTGSPKSVSGATSATLSITAMLAPNTTYTYTVTAIGDGVTFLSSAASVASASFTTASSTGTFTLQYAASEAATLFADLKAGAADIYELTESGGVYTFTSTASNNAILIRHTTVRAAAGLAAKPIIKLNSTSTGTTANIFYTATTGLTLRFDGLELDGANPASGGAQPIAIYDSGTGATNTKIYVTNCYFHDFKNVPGNGTIRMNGSSGTQVLDVQGSTFNACGGRILYLNGTTTGPNTTVNLKNNTFSNSTTLTSRNNVIYNAVANSGTTTIDHCTFYKVADAGIASGVLRITGTNGSISIKNSLFVSVPTILPASTVDYCYLAGLATVPTATNTFSTTPAFTNEASRDFTLTNRSSFTCGDGVTAGNSSIYPTLAKLSTPTVGSGDIPTSTGFTAHWTPVANASSYSVQTYLGSNLINATASAAGASTSSAVVTGLMSGLAYTYIVTAVGDNATYSNSDASASSGTITTADPDAKASFSTDFSDGTWGTIEAAVPANGAFTSGMINGFYLNNATLNVNTAKGPKGESHTNRISLDKSSTASSVSLPTITSVGQLEIHFAMGTALNTINVREFNATTNTWDLVGTYSYPQASKDASMDYIVIIPFATPHLNAKFKIENNTSGSCYITQIIARATNPALLTAPTTGTASNISATAFTANWTPIDANATNYEVKVYKGTTLKVTATTTGGQAATSLAITGLQADSTYTYKVKAIGDGDVAYSDSYQSAASASFTTISFTKLATPVLSNSPWAGSFPSTLVVNWLPVENASSYDVSLYEGTSSGSLTLLKTVNVSGQSTNMLSIDGSTADRYYTFTVTAKGDGILYSNSDATTQSGEYYNDLTTKIADKATTSKLIIVGNNVTAPRTGKIEVYNSQGVLVMSVQDVNKVNLNLKKGIYIVHFTGQSNIHLTEKLVIR
ncbi:MAG: fibronectin type III domain-containing protein [Bacteroidales bacterium]